MAGDLVEEEGQDSDHQEAMAEEAGVDRQEEAPDIGAEYQFLSEAAEARSGTGTKKCRQNGSLPHEGDLILRAVCDRQSVAPSHMKVPAHVHVVPSGRV